MLLKVFRAGLNISLGFQDRKKWSSDFLNVKKRSIISNPKITLKKCRKPLANTGFEYIFLKPN